MITRDVDKTMKPSIKTSFERKVNEYICIKNLPKVPK